MIPFLSGKLWGAVGVLAGVVALGVQAKTIEKRNARIETLQADARAIHQELQQAEESLHAREIELQATQQAHEQCMAIVRVDNQNQAAARDTIRSLVGQLRAEVEHARTEDERILAGPDCQDLATLDIASACPGLAERLRDRASVVSATKIDRGPGASTARP